MKSRGWLLLLLLPVLLSLAAFLIAFGLRLPRLTDKFNTAWGCCQDVVGQIGLYVVFAANWLIPPIVVTLVRWRLNRNRLPRALNARLETTRRLYTYFALAFYVVCFPLLLGMSDFARVILFPAFILICPAYAAARMLPSHKPSRFQNAFPSKRPGPHLRGPHPGQLSRLRYVGVGACFAAAGVWSVLEAQALSIPDSTIRTLEVLVGVLGTAGLVLLAFLLMKEVVLVPFPTLE